jgi:hypothetical protein
VIEEEEDDKISEILTNNKKKRKNEAYRVDRIDFIRIFYFVLFLHQSLNSDILMSISFG